MLTIAIQHHPSRAHLIDPLLERLGCQAEVVTDPDPKGLPSALRTYVASLRTLPYHADHLLVLQDDAWPVVPELRRRAEELVTEHPDALVALCVQNTGHNGQVMRLASKHGRSWVQLPRSSGWYPTIALAWPREHAERFVRYASRRYRHDHQSDDAPVAAYARVAKAEVWACVPSLVQHPDVVPSLIPNRVARAGRNRARVAAVLADDPSD